MNEQIQQILTQLRAAKGASHVAVGWAVQSPGQLHERGIAHAWPEHEDLADNGGIPALEKTADPVLHLGERLRLTIRSDRPGRLHVFNLGTSGAVTLLFPRAGWATDNEIVSGTLYEAPGNLIPPRFFPAGGWVEEGPLSAAHGLPERILAVVTPRGIHLSPRDLNDALPDVSMRGGLGSVEEVCARLFTLPEEAWGYGLVEIEVVP